jgi:thiosulfate reductase cytochrome b subunit
MDTTPPLPTQNTTQGKIALWIAPSTWIPIGAIAIALLVAAWIQFLFFGLPVIPTTHYSPDTATGPSGFAAWIRVTHYINLFFMVLLARSGLQILMDHPRLYWNVHCTPGTEWIRFTPVKVPTDRMYTAKEDARYLSPWIGIPGGRHTIGLARHWHFLSVLFWVGNGIVYVVLLLLTPHWQRIVPTSWDIFPKAWQVFVHYATFHLPPEPNGFYHYNALQQLSYFGVIFILAPLSMITGPAMSPALVNRFSWYRHLPGNRQVGRSLHFLLLLAYIAFVIVHVAMVIISGFARNMNHIVMGTDFTATTGMTIGLLGIVILLGANVAANWGTWLFPRKIQRIGNLLVNPVMRFFLSGHAPRAQYTRSDISPFFWPNGKLPTSDEWKNLAADHFKNYRLRIFGLVENPVELSMDDIRNLPKQQQITLQHCIQGWSGIAEWGGLPMLELMRLVRPLPSAKAVIFYSFGEGLDGGQYYDSHPIENMRHPQALLAWEMNDAPLNDIHGAPLRLRAENQLGFKMVKWIQAIEFAADTKHIFQGEGGYAEDHEFFDSMADI